MRIDIFKKKKKRKEKRENFEVVEVLRTNIDYILKN